MLQSLKSNPYCSGVKFGHKFLPRADCSKTKEANVAILVRDTLV